MVITPHTPTLSSLRLTLTPYEKADPDNVEWLNDKELMQFSEQRHRTHTLRSQQDYLKSFDRENAWIWQVVAAAGGELIGTVTARCDWLNSVAEMGILIGQGKCGYGTESWATVMKWLFDVKQIRKIEAGCMATNGAMRRIFDRTGMIYEGTSKLHFLVNSSPVSAVYYGAFKK